MSTHISNPTLTVTNATEVRQGPLRASTNPAYREALALVEFGLNCLTAEINHYISPLEAGATDSVDIPWWYIEPTSVGLLTTGMARADQLRRYAVLQQYNVAVDGRCDLFIRDRFTDTAYWFEAKQCATHLDDNAGWEHTDLYLNEVLGQAGRFARGERAIKGARHRTLVALVFETLSTPRNTPVDQTTALLQNWLNDDPVTNGPCDFYQVIHLVEPYATDGKLVYPAVAVYGKILVVE